MGTALVTGATSGIGFEFCRQLAAQGNNLVIVARDETRLQLAAAEFRTNYGVNVEVLRADLADEEDLKRVCARLALNHQSRNTNSDVTVPNSAWPATGSASPRESSGLPRTSDGLESVGFGPLITLLVNAAGFGLGKPFLDDSLEREMYGLDVMVRAVMATCHAGGRAMKGRGRGAIINIGSVAADSGMGTYSAHKSWVRSFSEGLAEELRDSGVKVTVVMPGLVRTEFHQRVGADYGTALAVAWSSPKTVVEQSLRATRDGRVVFVPTVRYRAVNAAQRLLPSGLVKAVTRRLPHM